MIKYVKDFTDKPKDFYVYTHHRLSDGQIFYVGKGTKKRCCDLHGRSKHWERVAKKHGVIVRIHQDGLREFYAFELEESLIVKHGRLDKLTGCLVNHADGGYSGVSWRKPSKEEIAKAVANRKTQKEDKQTQIAPHTLAGVKNFDKKEYCFVHKDTNETLTCTRWYFARIKQIDISPLFYKKTKTVKGWFVPELKDYDSNVVTRRLSKPDPRKIRDLNTYSFIHRNGEIFTGTRYDFQDKFNIPMNYVKTFFKTFKPNKTVRGWSLVKETNGN